MAESAEKLVLPYPPYALFARFIKDLADLGIPRRIDKSIFPDLSHGASSSLLGALRYLNLIGNDGVPTKTLTQLVAEPAKPEVLAPIVRGAYAFAFKDQPDLTGYTAAQLEDRLQNPHLSGGTFRKAVAFFIALTIDAGIPISPSLLRRRHPAPSERIPRRRSRKPEVPAAVSAPIAAAGESNSMAERTPLWCTLYHLLDTEGMTQKEQNAILTILLYLKKRDSTKETVVIV